MTTEIERRYVLTKIAAGDYLLPSNDGRSLFRISTYTDGPSYGLDWPRDRQLWRVTVYTGADDWNGLGLRPEDTEDWNLWGDISWQYETRAEAIQSALAEGEARG